MVAKVLLLNDLHRAKILPPALSDFWMGLWNRIPTVHRALNVSLDFNLAEPDLVIGSFVQHATKDQGQFTFCGRKVFVLLKRTKTDNLISIVRYRVLFWTAYIKKCIHICGSCFYPFKVFCSVSSYCIKWSIWLSFVIALFLLLHLPYFICDLFYFLSKKKTQVVT